MDVQTNQPLVTETGPCHCPKWTLRSRQWVYRGEGNASLVLALPQERKIIRLAKIDNKLQRMDSDSQFVANNVSGIRTIEETLERIVFAKKVLAPLLGQHLVSSCYVYHIDLDEIEEIERSLEAVRPAHRKHKRLAPVCHAVVCCDCTLLPHVGSREHLPEPIYCIELKPKQGFLSHGHEHCPFCLNQFLKRKHGKINILSEYCPLDLFSGSWPRMIKAIVSLVRTPQNNLRIFKEGSLVFAEECQADLQNILQQWFRHEDSDGITKHDAASTLPLRNFCSLIIQALTLDLCSNDEDVFHTLNNGSELNETIINNGTRCFDRVGELIDEMSCESCVNGEHESQTALNLTPTGQQLDEWLAQVLATKKRDHRKPCIPEADCLPSSCVLSKLLRVQSLGDVDFQQLYSAYEKLVERFRDGSLSYDQMRWTHSKLSPNWLLGDVPVVHDTNKLEPELDEYLQNSVRLVQRYRISSTTRDCSIMIAFQRINQKETGVRHQNLVSDSSGQWYSCKISIVDLDPKPVSCVEKHRRRNQAMTEAFLLSKLNDS